MPATPLDALFVMERLGDGYHIRIRLDHGTKAINLSDSCQVGGREGSGRQPAAAQGLGQVGNGGF
jgi:hypothetical protein